MARAHLSGVGYAVLTAANGGEALLICKERHQEIHLVLTDVVMPLMSGRVFSEWVAQAYPNIKVLYMSGYTDDTIIQHGVLVAGTHFIGKPFTTTDLTRKVREVLNEGGAAHRAALS